MKNWEREKFKSGIVHSLVKTRLEAGWSISRIARELGISYKHAKQIAQQVSAPEVTE